MKKLRSLLALVLVVAMLSSFAVVSANATPQETMSFSELYEMIDDAIENASGDSVTITLNRDVAIGDDDIGNTFPLPICDYNDPTQVTNFTIDLNGHSIYLNDDDGNYVNGFEIGDNEGDGISANVTFTNSSNNPSTIYYDTSDTNVDADSYPAIFKVVGNSTLTIEKINAKTYGYYNTNLVRCLEGNVVINSGDFKIDGEVIFSGYDYSGVDKYCPCSVTINGGTFEGIDDYASITESYNTDIEINGGTFTNFKWGVYGYGCDVTINNEDTYISTTYYSGVYLEELKSQYDSDTYYYSSLVINNGNFNTTGVYGAVYIDGGNVTINDGTFNSSNNYAVYLNGYCNYNEDNTVTINGGEYESPKNAIYIEGGNITINDGTFTSTCEYNEDHYFDYYNYATLYADSSGCELNLTINGGTFNCNGYDTLYIDGGNIEINDGNFTSDGELPCVYISNEYNYNTDAKVTFNGGTFKSTNSSVMLINMITDDEDLSPMDVIINGGTFKFDNKTFIPSELMLANYVGTIVLEDGNLTINKGDVTSNCYYVYGINQLDGNLKINDVNVNADYSSALRYKDGSLEINDGTFNGMVGLAISCEKPKITLNGGLYKSPDTIPEDFPFEIPESYIDAFEQQIWGIISNNSDFDLTSILGEGYSFYSADGKDEETISKKTIIFDENTQEEIIATSKVVAVEKTDAAVKDGKDAKIDASKATDTLFKSDVNYRWFENGEVKVDGKTVDSSNYTSASGSTDITLKASYLKTLSNGKHTLQIVSNVLGNKLVAETTFTVTNASVEETTKTTKTKEIEKVADTADNSMIGAFVALSAFAAAGYVTLKKHED